MQRTDPGAGRRAVTSSPQRSAIHALDRAVAVRSRVSRHDGMRQFPQPCASTPIRSAPSARGRAQYLRTEGARAHERRLPRAPAHRRSMVRRRRRMCARRLAKPPSGPAVAASRFVASPGTHDRQTPGDRGSRGASPFALGTSPGAPRVFDRTGLRSAPGSTRAPGPPRSPSRATSILGRAVPPDRAHASGGTGH